VNKLLAVTIALATQVAAAQSIGLQQFLDAAEKGNVDRKISAAQREKSIADARVAWTGLLPSLTAQAGWTHNQYSASFTLPDTQNPRTCSVDSDCESGEICSENKSYNPLTMQNITYSLCAKKSVIQPLDQLDITLRVDVPIIDTSRWLRTAASITATDAAEQREYATRDLVRRQVVGAYYGYAAALAVRESAKKSTAAAEAQAKIQEIRANAGAVTELDLLRARAEVQRNRQVVADTESLVATSRRSLNTLTGLAPPETLPLPADDARQAGPLPELEARVPYLPGVKAADLDIKAANELSTAAKLALVPTVAGNFSERFTNATGFTGEGAIYSLGLALVWRFDVATVMNMSSQEAAAGIARLALERAQLQARDQIHSDWQRLTASLIKIEAAAAQVTAASRAAQVARDRYAAGAGTQVDVIQAERDLFSAEVGQIQAKTELASARASLKISAGLPIQD
jgi:outer membrane protein